MASTEDRGSIKLHNQFLQFWDGKFSKTFPNTFVLTNNCFSDDSELLKSFQKWKSNLGHVPSRSNYNVVAQTSIRILKEKEPIPFGNDGHNRRYSIRK